MYGTLIQTQTLGADATITFSSIPSSYTDLHLAITARSAAAGQTQDNLFLTFNGSSATQYNWQGIKSTNLSIAAAPGTNQSVMSFQSSLPGGGSTTNAFGNAYITILNYASSNPKIVFADLANEQSGLSGYRNSWYAFWNNTAAINSITISAAGANITAGSTISLYGQTHF
jgi:hypothetical protein